VQEAPSGAGILTHSVDTLDTALPAGHTAQVPLLLLQYTS